MDPIADMLTRIKNAALVKKETVLVPYSQMKFEIANILKERGYISLVERRGRKNRKFLELGLAYEPDGSPRLHGAKRVSKPSRRIYRKVAEIRPVRR
ncbi:30S ribosomal protein S8, partial [Candidatus Giovannonibacteria bacterium RIFOXYC1_FULL_48_8]